MNLVVVMPRAGRFEVIDWWGIFGVKATPLKAALAETYRHPTYSQIVLEF
jgi:hypothetical protein